MNKKNPYPHNNFARTEDYLEELIRLNSGEAGRVPIPESNGGYEDLNVGNLVPVRLTVPDEAIFAEIHVEADLNSAVLSRAVRLKHNDSFPTADSGFLLGDGDVLEVYGRADLERFQVISAETRRNHVLRIQYYRSAAVESATDRTNAEPL